MSPISSPSGPIAFPSAPVACPAGLSAFAAGTLVDTDHGPLPVETLLPGDLVLTHDEGPRPLVWTGRMRAGTPAVLIRTGSLAPGLPLRDTIVAAGHPLLIERVLVPASSFEDGEPLPAPATLCVLLLPMQALIRTHGVWSASALPDLAFLAAFPDAATALARIGGAGPLPVRPFHQPDFAARDAA